MGEGWLTGWDVPLGFMIVLALLGMSRLPDCLVPGVSDGCLFGAAVIGLLWFVAAIVVPLLQT